MKDIFKIFIKTILFSKSEKHKENILFQAKNISREIYLWICGCEYKKVSLGQNCNSAWYLKESNNKSASYPFDWIFSSQEIVLHAVKDNFKSFLDKEMIFTINKEKAGHCFYHSRMFNHKNPLNSDEEYNYYKRCVHRFKDTLHSKKPIIFIYTVINEPDKRPSWSDGFNREIKKPVHQSIESFSKLINFIKNINPNSKFLFINQLTEGKLKIESKFINKDIIWIDFTSRGENTGVKYLDLIDDTIIKIIYQGLNKEYKFNN